MPLIIHKSISPPLNKYFDNYSPELKFVWIMSNENENVINQLSTFLIDAFRMRNHYGAE